MTIYPRRRSKSDHPEPCASRATQDYSARLHARSTPGLARGSVPYARVPDACSTFGDPVPDANSTFDNNDDTEVVDMPQIIQDAPAPGRVDSADYESIVFLPAPEPRRRTRKDTIRKGIYIDTVTRDGSVVRELFGSPTIECPGCGALAVCRMPPILASLQNDGTELACLPHHGGCGSGLKMRPPCR